MKSGKSMKGIKSKNRSTTGRPVAGGFALILAAGLLMAGLPYLFAAVPALAEYQNLDCQGGEKTFDTVSSDSTVTAGTTVTGTALDLDGTAGVTYDPGSDQDVDMATVLVGGTPRMYWNEGGNNFAFSHSVYFSGSITTTGTAFINNINANTVTTKGVSSDLIFKVRASGKKFIFNDLNDAEVASIGSSGLQLQVLGSSPCDGATTAVLLHGGTAGVLCNCLTSGASVQVSDGSSCSY